MKDSEIIICFNSEKLDALNFYMSKKDSEVQKELEETVESLYLKHVPSSTREYLEDKLGREDSETTVTKSVKKSGASVKRKKKDSKKQKTSEESCESKSADSQEELSLETDVDDDFHSEIPEEGENCEQGAVENEQGAVEDELGAVEENQGAVEELSQQERIDQLLHGNNDSNSGDSSGDGFLSELLN